MLINVRISRKIKEDVEIQIASPMRSISIIVQWVAASLQSLFFQRAEDNNTTNTASKNMMKMIMMA